MPMPTDTQNTAQRKRLISFIQKHLITTSTKQNPDLPILHNICHALTSHGLPDINTTLGLTNLHLYNLPMSVTCWTSMDTDEHFLRLAYTNTLGSSRAYLRHHVLSMEELRLIISSQNAIHQDQDQLYIAPVRQVWSDTRTRLTELFDLMQVALQEYIQPLLHHNNLAQYTIPTIKGQSNTGDIELQLLQPYYRLFDNADNPHEILLRLKQSTTPMLAVSKMAQPGLRESSIAHEGRDMFIALAQSHMKARYTTSLNATSPSLTPLVTAISNQQYKRWLQYQLDHCQGCPPIQANLQLALARATTSVLPNSRPFPAQIEELLIQWRCTMWTLDDHQRSTPLWTNKLTNHYRVPNRNNRYTVPQLVVLLNTDNDIEHSDRLTYLRPALEEALTELANNIYLLQQRTSTPPTHDTVTSPQTLPPSPLDNILLTDKYFLLADSKSTLQGFLYTGSNLDARTYPSTALRDKLSYLLPRTIIQQSSCGNIKISVSPTTLLRFTHLHGPPANCGKPTEHIQTEPPGGITSEHLITHHKPKCITLHYLIDELIYDKPIPIPIYHTQSSTGSYISSKEPIYQMACLSVNPRRQGPRSHLRDTTEP